MLGHGPRSASAPSGLHQFGLHGFARRVRHRRHETASPQQGRPRVSGLLWVDILGPERVRGLERGWSGCPGLSGSPRQTAPPAQTKTWRSFPCPRRAPHRRVNFRLGSSLSPKSLRSRCCCISHTATEVAVLEAVVIHLHCGFGRDRVGGTQPTRAPSSRRWCSGRARTTVFVHMLEIVLGADVADGHRCNPRAWASSFAWGRITATAPASRSSTSVGPPENPLPYERVCATYWDLGGTLTVREFANPPAPSQHAIPRLARHASACRRRERRSRVRDNR